MSEADPRDRYLEANNWPENHVEVSRESLDWLARTGTDADNVLRLQRVRQEHPDVVKRVWQAAVDDTSRKILMAVLSRSGASYNTLENWVPRAGRRTLKRKVSALRDDVLISRGRPAMHHFASPAAELITEDVLALVD